MKSPGEDDNIADMDNNNSVLIIGIIIFVIIVIMLLAAFMLLKGSGDKKRRKIKIRIVKGKRSRGAAVASAVAKAGSRKSGKGLPSLSPMTDDGIEKYAKMTEEYVHSEFGIELKRLGLKKYYSDRHGFNCVDFTYKPADGAHPAQLKGHLNDLDTALSNVSGVDTISFVVDISTGTYRTTFYKV